LTADLVESWELFLMAAHRETFTDKEKEVDQFSCDWDFVNAWLTHAHVENKEQLLRDLITLQRGLNT
jgi:hypothetical protein